MIWMQNLIMHPTHVLFALGRCILKQFGAISIFILASVYMVMVRVCTRFIHAHSSSPTIVVDGGSLRAAVRFNEAWAIDLTTPSTTLKRVSLTPWRGFSRT